VKTLNTSYRFFVYVFLPLMTLTVNALIVTPVNAQSSEASMVIYQQLVAAGWKQNPSGPNSYQSPDGNCWINIKDPLKYGGKLEDTEKMFRISFASFIMVLQNSPNTEINYENYATKHLMRDGSQVYEKEFYGMYRGSYVAGTINIMFKGGFSQEFHALFNLNCNEKNTAQRSITSIGGGILSSEVIDISVEGKSPNNRSSRTNPSQTSPTPCEDECSKDFAFCVTQLDPMNCAGKLRACNNACR
jgi:hypothetical protein